MRWWHKIYDEAVGEKDFEITFKDNCIEVRYCRIREDISSRSPNTLSLPELESEIKLLALLIPILPEHDKQNRLKACLDAWVAIKRKELEKETDPEKRQKLQETFKRELLCMGVPESPYDSYVINQKKSTPVYRPGYGWDSGTSGINIGVNVGTTINEDTPPDPSGEATIINDETT